MQRKVFFISTTLLVLLVGLAGFNLTQKNNNEVLARDTTPQVTQVAKKTDQNSEKAYGILPGYYAPDFTLENLEGRRKSLSDYQGKYVLLNFWAVWCPPCKAEMPDLNEFHLKNEEEMIVLGVELGSKPDEVQKVIREGQYEYPILLDTKNQIGRQYRISAVPTTYILNPEGKILHVIRGKLDSKTLELIKETFVEQEEK